MSDSQERYPHLSKVQTPADLKQFSDKELLEVANEVRQAILDKVSQTGGHFSSNLGTVELTVALYAVLNMPEDKVVWDTGHQAYPHKILTGRLNRFDTLRKHKGLSGFLKRDESEFDIFGAGHAGTAISAALGFAASRDQLQQQHRVVAIAGDASICSGMSWEALNHAGDLGTDMIVILNDNRMSIAPNVGALTSYFTRLRARPYVQDLAQRAKKVVEKLPSPVTRVAAGLRHGLTHYFAPEETGTIFEEMGFEYIGPVDGHDLPTLLELFRNITTLKGPIFIHAITTKGKGYAVAEEDATKWHGVTPFNLEACEITKASGPVSYTQAFGAEMLELAQSDDKVVAITAAMPDGTGLNEFAKRFPNRYYDTGIAEQHAVTFAAGLAAGGIKPFCAIYSTFLQRGYDQVLHDVCIQNLPVRFMMDRAGLVGDDGPTHHGTFDLSYLRMMPNMTLLAPRDTTELREMMRFCAGFDSGPIAVRYPRGAGDDRLPEQRQPIQIGKAEVLCDGTDLTLVAFGSMVSVAWETAQLMKSAGISCEVINGRFIKPLDADTISESIKKTGRWASLEENVQAGGVGEAVLAAMSDLGLSNIPHRIIALPDKFIEHGSQPIIRDEAGLSANRIKDALLEWLQSPNMAMR